MTKHDLKQEVSELLAQLVVSVEQKFNVEIDFDDTTWHEMEDKLTDHLLEGEVLSEEEIRENELLNQADALSDDSRGR